MTDRENTPAERKDQQMNQQSRAETGPQQGEGSLLQGKIPRRAAIGGILAAVGLVAWQSLDDDSDSQSDEEPPASDQESTASPWQYEKEVREQYQTQQVSLVPSFDYDRISVESDSEEDPITRIAAAPAESGNGDQLLFVVDDGFGHQLRASLAGFFTSTENSSQQQTMIDGSEVTFDVHTNEEVTVAAGSQGVESGEEVYVARGDTAETAESLVDSYDVQYSEWQ